MNVNLPWVEKYRPKTLEELISHEDILTTINKFLKEGRLPHLLLYGPPGTGKTSTILAIAKALYSSNEIGSMVLELNASDDRGIDIIRGAIFSFASTKSIFKSGFKLVILDEADAMTNDGQNALRRIIERYTQNTRFCLICNYLSKIIPALQSRCTRFRFGPLNDKQIIPRIEYIIKQEGITVTKDGKQSLLELGQGDMRKIINLLQSTSMAFDIVNEKNVYLCCGQPFKSDIEEILQILLSSSFREAYKLLSNIKKEKSLALQDVITKLHLSLENIELPTIIKIDILDKMATIENYLASGCNESLQLSALIAAFQGARENMKK